MCDDAKPATGSVSFKKRGGARANLRKREADGKRGERIVLSLEMKSVYNINF